MSSQLSLGRLAYLAWYRPVGMAKRLSKNGIGNSVMAILGERDMRIAAASLAPARWRADSGGAVAFLTGTSHWHQTLLCAWSLLEVSNCDLSITVYDDGSLREENIAALRRALSGIRIVLLPEIEESLERNLPTKKFPVLRQRRLIYPHLRKLTDVHAGRSGPIVVLDSDMLFLRRPAGLLDWLMLPVGGCCMRDCMTSYGYPMEALQALLPQPLMEAVNVGIAGLRSEEIDWNMVEHWCSTLLEDYGPSYFLEQALSALLFSERATVVMPRSDYIVAPTSEQMASGKGVLHHYVAESKYAYRRAAWRVPVSGASREKARCE